MAFRQVSVIPKYHLLSLFGKYFKGTKSIKEYSLNLQYKFFTYYKNMNIGDLYPEIEYFMENNKDYVDYIINANCKYMRAIMRILSGNLLMKDVPMSMIDGVIIRLNRLQLQKLYPELYIHIEMNKDYYYSYHQIYLQERRGNKGKAKNKNPFTSLENLEDNEFKKVIKREHEINLIYAKQNKNDLLSLLKSIKMN